MTKANNVIDATCSERECKGKGSYKVPIYCLNCKWKGFIKWTKGHHSYTITRECPNCGCMELKR